MTNKYAVANPSLLSVKFVEKEDGMISFTVDFKHKKARHVVAHMKASDVTRTFSESHTPMFTVTETSKYFFSVTLLIPALLKSHRRNQFLADLASCWRWPGFI